MFHGYRDHKDMSFRIVELPSCLEWPKVSLEDMASNATTRSIPGASY